MILHIVLGFLIGGWAVLTKVEEPTLGAFLFLSAVSIGAVKVFCVIMGDYTIIWVRVAFTLLLAQMAFAFIYTGELNWDMPVDIAIQDTIRPEILAAANDDPELLQKLQAAHKSYINNLKRQAKERAEEKQNLSVPSRIALLGRQVFDHTAILIGRSISSRIPFLESWVNSTQGPFQSFFGRLRNQAIGHFILLLSASALLGLQFWQGIKQERSANTYAQHNTMEFLYTAEAWMRITMLLAVFILVSFLPNPVIPLPILIGLPITFMHFLQPILLPVLIWLALFHGRARH